MAYEFGCAFICYAPSIIRLQQVGAVQQDEQLLCDFSRKWSEACSVERFNPGVIGDTGTEVFELQRNNRIIKYIDSGQFDLVVVAGAAATKSLRALLIQLLYANVPIWNFASPDSYLYQYLESLLIFGKVPEWSMKGPRV